MSSIESEVSLAIEPIISEANFYLESIQVTSAGKHSTLRILIDGEKPLTLAEVAAITKPISERLDSLLLLGDQSFTLEVSSPGVEFPLTLPRHWQKNSGRLVLIKRKDGREVSGRICACNEESVRLADSRGEEREVSFAEIASAQIEIEFK